MTTTDTPTPCPACDGLSEPGHPAGWLGGWHHTGSCLLLPHEDSRRVADGDLIATSYHPQRRASATERALLASLGFTLPSGDLLTEVSAVTATVVRRTWPLLAGAA